MVRLPISWTIIIKMNMIRWRCRIKAAGLPYNVIKLILILNVNFKVAINMFIMCTHKILFLFCAVIKLCSA